MNLMSLQYCMIKIYLVHIHTVCPRSSGSLYIAIYYIHKMGHYFFDTELYWVTQKLPQIHTANHPTFPIRIRKITVQICGNFWVTRYVVKYVKLRWTVPLTRFSDFRPYPGLMFAVAQIRFAGGCHYARVNNPRYCMSRKQ